MSTRYPLNDRRDDATRAALYVYAKSMNLPDRRVAYREARAVCASRGWTAEQFEQRRAELTDVNPDSCDHLVCAWLVAHEATGPIVLDSTCPTCGGGAFEIREIVISAHDARELYPHDHRRSSAGDHYIETDCCGVLV